MNFTNEVIQFLKKTSSPLMGEDEGGGGHNTIPLTPTLSPAFAEAATRRQAPREREIVILFPERICIRTNLP